MITIRKLRSLPPDTRLRKAVLLLDRFVQYRELPDPKYLTGVLAVITEIVPQASVMVSGVHQAIDVLGDDASTAHWTKSPAEPLSELLRALDDLRHDIRRRKRVPVADWDMIPPAGYGSPTAHGREATAVPEPAFPGISIFLEDVRSPFNVGSVIRTAAAMGIGKVLMTPRCPSLDHPRVRRSARGCDGLVSAHSATLDDLVASGETLIALETGGTPLSEFQFPPHGVLLIGSEELGLTSRARHAAASTVSVELSGFKPSLNLGVACGIALHAWCLNADD